MNQRELCVRSSTRRFVELAVQVLLRSASASAREAEKLGKLLSLGAVEREGCVWVSGRVQGEGLAKIVGTRELPILLNTEKLSYSILAKCHRQDHHKSPQDIAARSRHLVWITGSTRTAKTVASSCMYCSRGWGTYPTR